MYETYFMVCNSCVRKRSFHGGVASIRSWRWRRNDGPGRSSPTTPTCCSRSPALLTCAVRDIADLVGITERTAMQIVSDLEADGYITRIREGRRNRYVVDADHHLRHPLEDHHHIDELLEALAHRPP